jgi:site-specific recombinase XerD
MDKNCISLSAALEGYFIAAHARRLSPATLRDYDNTFRKLEEFLGRDPPLSSITPADIRGFLSSMDGLSAKTLLNYHTGLSALWTWAVKEGVAEEHILHKVRRPSADRDRAIILLLVDTGMRASELCNLRIQDLDMANHRVRVMGKGRKERMLPIAARTSQAIWRYLATRDTKRDSAFLFATKTERQLERNNVRNTLKRIGERAGVSGVTLHRFRHTFAITFLRNNGHIMALQRLLGHATLDMVSRYLSIVQADIENAHKESSPVANWLL